MFGSLLSVLTAILDVLPKFLNKKNKRKIGSTLAKLFLQLKAVCKDGKKILDTLEKLQSGRKVNFPNLMKVVETQAYRLNEIKSITKKDNLAKILQIHLPEVEDLKIYIGMKGSRVSLLHEELSKNKKLRFLEPITISHPMMARVFTRWAKLIPSSKSAIQRARKQLKEIERITEEMRKILVSHFEIDEII